MSFVKSVSGVFLASMFLFSCVDQTKYSENSITPLKTVPHNRAVQKKGPEASQKLDVINTREAVGENSKSGSIYSGSGSFVSTAGPKASIDNAVSDNGDISLHFVNTSIADVAKSVLGDLLKLDYVVSPSVQGTVTLETSHPINRSSVIPALQAAFRLAGASVVEVKGTWRIVPIAEAQLQGTAIQVNSANAAQSPGFAMQIVPLHYVSVEDMQRLLAPLAPQGAIVKVDQARNILIIGGSAQELASMRDQVSTFDVDWMAGMSFALLPLEDAKAKSVAAELREILGRESGPIGNVVRIVPIERMNALLLISPQVAYLKKLKIWVERLDHSSGGDDDVRLYVYHVQNGRAADLAEVLHKVFTKSAKSSLGSSHASEFPNSSAEQSSSVENNSSPMKQDDETFGNGAEGGTEDSGSGEGDSYGAGAADSDAGPQITADETNNALLILTNARQYASIESALKSLDTWPLQVLIETSIAEVTLTHELQYGVQYYLQSGNYTVLRTATTSLIPKIPVPGFSFIFSAGNNQAILNLLESKTNVKLMSTPQMMVLNNQTATLQVGNEVPIQTQSATSVQTPGAPIVSSIEYRNTGVLVKMTPRVNENGLVLLDIGQEVSDVAQTTTSGIDSPSFTQRKFTSSIAIRDGQTIALGGLISDSNTVTKSGLPFLSDLPYVGPLFGSTTKNEGRTELLMLITPHVIHTEQDASAITDEIRQRMRSLAPLEKLTQ